MPLPIFGLTTTGTDPKLSTRQLLEADVNTVVASLYHEISAVVGGLNPRGSWDASAGTFPSGTAKGDYYIVSVAGTVDSQVFVIGDWLISLTADASTSTFAADWFRAEYSLIDSDQFSAIAAAAAASAASALASETLAAAYVLRTPKTPYDFGAVGDGVTDDTASVKAWIESGGRLRGAAGEFLIAAAGADAGGVDATVSNSTWIELDPNCSFNAGANLDNDILRVSANPTGYTATRSLTFEFYGGKFDQRLQRNSTVIPFITEYPAYNAGTSSTCDALSIRGEIDNVGTPVAGFWKVSVGGVITVASSADHWNSDAGGDGGIFVGAARHIEVESCLNTGARDLGIYISGLSAGTIEGQSSIVKNNKFVGCLFGAASKRNMENTILADNIGYKTAVVVTSTSVTDTGPNVKLQNNIGHGAWIVARVQSGDSQSATGNISHGHGHLLADGSIPSTVFNANNACVRFEEVTNSEAKNNRITGRNPTLTGGDAQDIATVLLGDTSTGNIVSNNNGNDANHIVTEKTGEADYNLMSDNDGTNLDLPSTSTPVSVDGTHSIDFDRGAVDSNATSTITGTTSSTTLYSTTIYPNWLSRRSRIEISVGGDFTGTANTKILAVKIAGSSQRSLTAFGSIAGGFYYSAVIELNTLSSQRMALTASAVDEIRTIHERESVDFDVTGGVLIEVVGKLEDVADSIVGYTFNVRVV